MDQTQTGGTAGEDPQDRRQTPRFPVKLHVQVRLVEADFVTTGHTVDVSSGGALLLTASPLRPGTTYEMQVDGPTEPYTVRAHVIREIPTCLYAVEFEGQVTVGEIREQVQDLVKAGALADPA